MPKYDYGWFKKKKKLQWFELQAEQDAFPFLLKRMTDRLWLFRAGYLAAVF